VSILAPGKRNLEEYYVASSVQEALAYLRAHHGEAQVIAGGTALMPQVQRGECTARRLVDISRIHAMKSITAHDGYLIVGGAVTFAALLASELVRQKAPLLHQAAMLVGTPQVRHLATLAGNVIWGDGAAEGAVALVALDSEVEITNFTGAQWLRVESVLVRPGVSRVDSMAELVTSVRVPSQTDGQVSALGEIAPPTPDRRSPFVLALVLTLKRGREIIDWASVVAGSETSVPLHLRGVEAELAGRLLRDRGTREEFVNGVVASAREKLMPGESPSFQLDEIAQLAAKTFDRAAMTIAHSVTGQVS